MARGVTVVSGLGDAGAAAPRTALIGWSLILGTVALVFVGTLALRPGKGS